MLLEVKSTDHAGASSPVRGYSDAENSAMLRAVLNLFSLWGLSDNQAATLLGGVASKTIQRWRGGAKPGLSIDQSDRISNLLGIHKALRILFTQNERAHEWVTLKNEAFGGFSALDIMLNGHFNDIVRVRTYLDSVRGGW